MPDQFVPLADSILRDQRAALAEAAKARELAELQRRHARLVRYGNKVWREAEAERRRRLEGAKRQPDAAWVARQEVKQREYLNALGIAAKSGEATGLNRPTGLK